MELETYLARAALDANVTVLTQSRALHGEGERGTGIGGLEGSVVLLVVGSGLLSGQVFKGRGIRRKESAKYANAQKVEQTTISQSHLHNVVGDSICIESTSEPGSEEHSTS